MVDKAKIQKMVGYGLVFVALVAVGYMRRSMIKEFLGIKPEPVVSKDMTEEEKAEYAAMAKASGDKLKAMQEQYAKEGKTIQIPGLPPDMAAKVQEAQGQAAPPAANAPSPDSASQPAGQSPAPSAPGTTTGVAASPPAPMPGPVSPVQNPAPGAPGTGGLRGLTVEVVKPTEIYLGTKVLATAPKGTRFTIQDEREEKGKKWLSVKFKRKGETAPISGWVIWDDVTLAAAPVVSQSTPQPSPVATPAQP